ncbi:CheR family methyltransferase [Methanosarcina horonobensis]|uniref:CheR family methyltransferase n=1 Tax=Methanosarcina horonobensis TaxID=418008 RepID=UPI000A75F9BB|nr:protein-glutamate O-methyltransferase CheR [Methanosarcina horonobensis]
MVVNLDDDFNFLIRKISKSSGIVLSGYRDSYLRRRIDLRMKAVGTNNYTAYMGLLEKDKNEMKEVINTLTVNVTEFMRDKTPFIFFREEILPDIMERKKQCKSNMVRFWSAACSYGEEPYSIGICSKEVLPDDWTVSIYATDIDEKCLEGASQGVYSKEQLKKHGPFHCTKVF